MIKKFTPNGNKDQCQCVRDHDTMVDGAIEQCTGSRSMYSNQFCTQCEELHGEYLTKKYGGTGVPTSL